MTKQKTLSWIQNNHPCGCQIKVNRIGAIKEVIFCQKHAPSTGLNYVDLLLHLAEKLEVKKGTIIWDLKHKINDSCCHCEKEHAISKHEILQQFVNLIKKLESKNETLASVKIKKCRFCHKTNFLYCEIKNLTDQEKAGWDYYPFSTKENVESYIKEMKMGNFKNAQVYKKKSVRKSKEHVV
jgi:hypothetical protein